MEIPAPDVIPAGRPTAWEQKVSAVSEHAIKEEEEPLPKEIQRVPVEEPLWDEDLPEETVSLADLEEEKRAAEKATETPIYNSGKAEYEGKISHK